MWKEEWFRIFFGPLRPPKPIDIPEGSECPTCYKRTFGILTGTFLTEGLALVPFLRYMRCTSCGEICFDCPAMDRLAVGWRSHARVMKHIEDARCGNPNQFTPETFKEFLHVRFVADGY